MGDLVYLKRGNNLILGVGKISSDYIYDDTLNSFRNIRKVDWLKFKELNTEEYLGHKIAFKTLTKWTSYPDSVKKLVR